MGCDFDWKKNNLSNGNVDAVKERNSTVKKATFDMNKQKKK